MIKIVRKLLYLMAIVGVLCSASSALADTVTLAYQNDPYGQTGPYQFLVNGVQANLICYNDQTYIQGGEVWTANVTNLATYLTGLSGSTKTTYEELGYFTFQLNANPGNANIQNAIWALFNSNDINSSSNALDAQALAAIAAGNVNYAGVNLFTWNGSAITNQYCSNGTCYAPQPFTDLVPEASTLALLGAGLVALVALV